MRSALICVFFAIVVQKEGSRAADVDFQPTPIPLNDWTGGKRTAGTLQEFFKTDTPPTVAALPAHYWEDALRHSVYLSLVRDKIDQLIAKGSIISPDSEPHNLSKEVDDHDLWEKIKTAPFDRVKEDALPPGDVIILARGKLLEDKEGYRFAEDDALSDKCSKDNCTQTVKAYWSVKRVRQTEKSPGKYHYELTFSVTSQPPKKVKETYENPVRTFTIKENPPKEQPPPKVYRQPAPQQQTTRGQRAVWVHGNILNNAPHYKRQVKARTLERIFSSLFSDEDNYDEVPSRYKPNSYVQSHKLPDNSYNQKPSYIPMLSRPPLQPPPLFNQRPHISFDKGAFNQHIPVQQSHLYLRPSPIKSNKQAVLPTPIMNYQLSKESSDDAPVRTTLNNTEYTTKQPEMLTTTNKFHKHLAPPPKLNHFPENIRPPIFNAPPGVFVTMDKKPFKPMPPLRLPNSHKPQKTMLFDFRPSPQILDDSNNDSDFLSDTAFRPITINLTDVTNSKKRSKNQPKKPPKKHDHVKYQRLTTVSPDIITVRSNLSEEQENTHWVELLGAFTKTTPMATQKDKENVFDINLNTNTDDSSSSTEYDDDVTTINSNTTSTSTTTTTTTTTNTPKTKRTRPPPKFKRTEKNKKNKRVTTSTTTTAKPPRQTLMKPFDDLMPQASSASLNGSSFVRENKQEDVSNSSTSTTNAPNTSTTSRTTTTRVPISFSTSNVDYDTSSSTIQPKNRNRFRQSTLMLKGTSVKHDKWSASASEKNKSQTQSSQKFSRRKASKFQGYVPLTTPRIQDRTLNREDHEDYGFSSNRTNKDSMAYNNDTSTVITPMPPVKEVSSWKNDYDMNDLLDFNEQDKETTEDEAKTDDEDQQETLISEETVTSGKNHTKCKKKKHANLTTTEIYSSSTEMETTTDFASSTSSHLIADASEIHDLFDESTKRTTTTNSTQKPEDIFEEIFKVYTLPDDWEKQQTTAETTKSDLEDYGEDFMHSSIPVSNVKNYDDEEEEDEESSLHIHDANSKRANDDYYYEELDTRADDTQLRPLSLFGLMTMD